MWHGRLEFPEQDVLRRQQKKKIDKAIPHLTQNQKTQIERVRAPRVAPWHPTGGPVVKATSKQEATVFGITACVSHPAKLVARSPAKGGGSFLAGDCYASRAADDRAARPDQNCDDGPQGGGAINLVVRWFISSHLIS